MTDTIAMRNDTRFTLGFNPAAVLLVALALSIGWGVRGNWGHEYGAMIPGALAAMAAAIVSGRHDWHRRIAYFAIFGALGWSFGGSMAYMVVIGYTHSGVFSSVLYGFACLFAIGFLWGAVGGAGTALPAVLDRQRLTSFFPPMLAVFAAWAAQEALYLLARAGDSETAGIVTRRAHEFVQFLEERPISAFDTDWLAVVLAICAVMLLAIVRRKFCDATSLILHMAVGWWIGFSLLVLVLGLHVIPGKSDNWAGSLGMVIGMFVFLVRAGWFEVTYAAILTGFFAGLGFSGATLLKLVGIHATGLETNWHSILEQSFGFISGIGVAISMAYLSTRTVGQSDEPPVRRWTEPFSVAFVLLLVTWLNISKNPEAVWLADQTVPAEMYGLPFQAWFNLAYSILAVAFIALLIAHYCGRRVALVPDDWLGKAQLMFLIFLWWIVIGNLSRYLPFAPQRLVTEGVIHVNACLATLIVLALPRSQRTTPALPIPDYRRVVVKLLWSLPVFALLAVVAETAIVRDTWGDTWAEGHSGYHVRFGDGAPPEAE